MISLHFLLKEEKQRFLLCYVCDFQIVVNQVTVHAFIHSFIHPSTHLFI